MCSLHSIRTSDYYAQVTETMETTLCFGFQITSTARQFFPIYNFTIYNQKKIIFLKRSENLKKSWCSISFYTPNFAELVLYWHKTKAVRLCGKHVCSNIEQSLKRSPCSDLLASSLIVYQLRETLCLSIVFFYFCIIRMKSFKSRNETLSYTFVKISGISLFERIKAVIV